MLPTRKMASEIERRKRAHIDTVLQEDVGAKGVTTGFEQLYFDHVALPEIDLDAIDTRVIRQGRSDHFPVLAVFVKEEAR